MSVWQSFNLNHYVKVKLNDRGRDILRRKNAEYEAMFPSCTWPMPDEDADGYSRWQLWVLMQDFGPHIGCGLAPFDTEILLDTANG